MKKTIYSLFGVLIIFLILIYIYAIKPNTMAVMQGYTDPENTNFVIASNKKNIHCEIFEQDQSMTIPAASEQDIVYKDPTSIVHHCSFQRLSPRKQYHLAIKHNSEIIETRSFKTLDIQKNNFDVAIESCTSDIVHLPWLWDNLKAHNPDYLFMIGDNVYADLFHDYAEINESHLWDRYFRSWQVFRIFQHKELTPVLAIWDDHDFGQNNSDSSYDKKEFTLFLFRTFFNQEKETEYLKQGPGTSFIFSIHKQHFIFLDARSFRDSNSNPSGSYFSKEQTEWIKNQFKEKPNEYFWLISGSQWFGTQGQDESFEVNHPETVLQFMKEIDIRNHNAQLISGDTHFSEIKKITLEEKSIFEITSSAMHALPVGKIEPDARRIAASNLPNFVLARIDTQKNLSHSFTAYTLFNYKLFESNLH